MNTITTEKIRLINILCRDNQLYTLSQILKDLPGSMAILISDMPAEWKRKELLKLIKGERPTAATVGLSRVSHSEQDKGL